MLGAMSNDPVRDVQTWYPQIYLACHVDHKRPKTTRSGISPRESSLLCGEAGTTPVISGDTESTTSMSVIVAPPTFRTMML
jgi:hypothetical protein